MYSADAVVEALARIATVVERLSFEGTLLPNVGLDLAANRLLAAVATEPITVPEDVRLSTACLLENVARLNSPPTASDELVQPSPSRGRSAACGTRD